MGFGLWIGINYLQTKKQEPEFSTKQEVKPENTPLKPVEQKQKENDDKNLVRTETDQKKPVQKQEQNQEDNLIKPQQQDLLVKNKELPKPTNLPEPKNEDVAIQKDPVKSEILTNNLEKPDDPLRVVDKGTPVVQTKNGDAQYASYINDAEVKNENYVFYNITTEEFRKSKIGNFLKKAKRVIENRIPFKGKA